MENMLFLKADSREASIVSLAVFPSARSDKLFLDFFSTSPFGKHGIRRRLGRLDGKGTQEGRSSFTNRGHPIPSVAQR